MRRDSFNVLFFIKKTKLLKNGEASVCMRITVNGARVETNIRKSIEPVSWNQAKECARGKSRKSTELNNYIEESRIKLHRIYTQLEENGELITARILQEKFFGVDKKVEQVRSIIGTMREHNEQCRALVGKDFALITVRRYESCTRYLAELIKLKYDKEDLPITEVNGELVRAFEFYLKTEKNCQQNTVIRYMKCLKKIINLALANEWIEKNPFAGIKFHEKEVVREFLTMDELMTIYQKEFSLPRLALVRDVFIQVKRYKQKGTIPLEVTPKKILFSEFTNETRFIFFYRLTTHLQNDIFSCENIKDISIKPEEDYVLPEGISWMNRMKKILISGDSLDKTFFMSEKSYHSSLVLWNIEAVFSFDYKGEKGTITICLGFPDYNKKMHNAEFEITIRSLNIKNRLTSKAKKTLESKLLSEMDKQKSLVYSNFIEYLNNQKK